MEDAEDVTEDAEDVEHKRGMGVIAGILKAVLNNNSPVCSQRA